MNAAPSVSYLELEGCAGKRFFRCQALRSTLSTDGCSANWRRAQRLRPDEITGVHLCKSCPIGAAHAGERHIHRSRIFGAGICPRCRRGGARMISGRLCVGCYNRGLEFKKQKNGRGTLPLFRFDPRRVGVVIDGAYVVLRDEHTADVLELIVQTLSVTPSRLKFTRAGGGPVITTAELAARYRGNSERPARKPHGAAVPGGKRRRTAA